MHFPTLWVLLAAASLSTTKYLIDHGFPFPMHLLAVQLTCTLGFRILQLLFQTEVSQLPRPATYLEALSNRSLAIDCVAQSICFFGALLCGYQAIQHLPNLPAVVMVLTLDWRPWEASIFGVPHGFSAPSAWLQTSVVLLGTSMILAFDFRPSITGIEMSLLGAAFWSGAQYLQTKLDQVRTDEVDAQQAKWENIGFRNLAAGICLVTIWCGLREQHIWNLRPYSPWTLHLPVLVFNVVCSALCITVGGGFFRQLAPEEGQKDSACSEQRRLGHLYSSVALTCLVTTACFWNCAAPPVISMWQWVGFSVASLAVSPVQETLLPKFELVGRNIKWTRKSLLDSNDDTESTEGASSEKTNGVSIRPIICAALVLIVEAIYLGMLFGLKDTDTAVNSLTGPILDRAYSPTRPLDVVVARYDESMFELSKHLMELLSLFNIQRLSPNFIIYNKNQTSSPSELLQDLQTIIPIHPLPNITIHNLENIGRETDTYLEHITRNWHDLANHTLFMQAGVHFGPRAYLRQIRDYFVPSTGFMSLAPPSHHCSSCDNCFDRDWTEYPSILHSIFKDFNHGADCADLVLTYRGQFIASAARICGNAVETYRRWLRELRRPQSFLHTAPYTESAWSRKNDSMSAPRVGFTLERTWGVMLQCNEKRIADRCPTMLSSAICPPAICGLADLKDCQCLD